MKKRIFAALLCVIMLFGMLPITALAAEPTAHAVTIERTGEVYEDLVEAVKAAESGDTIQLGEGNYTLYGVSSTGHTEGKDLTFVGLGADKTAWNIGALVPDPANYGTEYNGDYSFSGAGTVTFQNMTLRSGTADYLGFIRADKTVVENCTINGKTFYWGYKSATFTNTTFNCPSGDYAIWTYCSPTMTFENCTFNSSGKVINVYAEYCAGKQDIFVNFKNCTVNNTSSDPDSETKPVLNVNDSNMGNYKHNIYISGDNKVSGISVDSTTCSRLFGFGGKASKYNTGRLDVFIENTKVWEGGKRVGEHAQNFSTGSYDNGVAPGELNQYTEGYKDNAFEITATKWEWIAEKDCYTREVSRTCEYCGDHEEKEENGYLVSYDLNGGERAENEEYEEEIVAEGTPIALKAAPSKDGYVFAGWSDGDTTYKAGDAVTVEHAMTFTAQWKLEGEEIIAGMTGLLTVAGLGTDDHIAYVYGYPDGTVRPNGTITRAEVTTIFYRLLTSARRDEIFTSENSFRDVNSSMWYNKATSSMAAGGYIQGYADGTFGANKPITRAEFVCLAARFATKTTGFASYTDVDNGHWAARSIAICASNGWVQGYEDGTFRPDQPITRAEAMTIINRMLGRGVSKGYVCKGAVRYTDNDPGSWYYFEVLEATNDHEYRNARPFEQWIRATILRSYDMDKYERP